MESFYECRFYTVTNDLSVIQCDTLDDCIQIEDFLYGIEEVYTNNGTQSPQAIRLFDRRKVPVLLNENGWKMTALNITPTTAGYPGYVPAVDIEDPSGVIQTLTADKDGHEGWMQLYRLFRYNAIAADWNEAKKQEKTMKYAVNAKKIFIRLKNGHTIRRIIDINEDAEYVIDLSYKNNLFQMHSCIVEGDPYIGGVYKNEEDYRTADFNTFICTILAKFPNIDLTI